jgi:hypothetical protein
MSSGGEKGSAIPLVEYQEAICVCVCDAGMSEREEE